MTANKTEIVWKNVALYIYLHVGSLYGLVLLLKGQVMWQTCLWGIFVYALCIFGVTAGPHRLWSHRSYKATNGLKIFLAILQTMAFQNSIYIWCRDHRLHHKYTETNADPHNVKRGFFFAHVGWLLCRKHEEIKEKGKLIDLSDLETDPVVMFQQKHYLSLALPMAFIVPVVIPCVAWGESGVTAWFFMSHFRYCVTLHVTWCINSVAHLWGQRPYDKSIYAVENKLLSIVGMGEGWHNYHHVFPWDYKAAEFGHYGSNLTTAAIDLFAHFGWASDLKTVPRHVIHERIARTGQGSRVSRVTNQIDKSLC